MKQTGCFEALWQWIWSWICQSGTYRVLRGIYDGISSGWRRSKILTWWRCDHGRQEFLSRSLVGRLLRLPFTLTDVLRNKIGTSLCSLAETSVLLGLCKTFLHNLLALNLRFLGVLFLGIGAGMVFGKAVGTLSLVLMIAGAVLALFDVNLTEWLAHSALVKAVLYLLGAEADFDWFLAEETVGRQWNLLAGAVGIICGLAGSVTVPILGILIPFAVAGVLLVLSKPIAGLYLLVFAAPILPTMAMAGLSVLCLAALVLKSVTDPDFAWEFDGLAFLITAFLVIYLIAGITSFVPKKSLSIFAIYLVFIGGYFSVTQLVKTKKQFRNLLTVFVLSGTAVCLYGIAQYVFGWDINQAWMDEEMFSDIKMRIYSTLENPNVLGEYILLVLPAAIGLMWTRKGVLPKLVYGGIAVMMFVALILTFSRGCWIGLLVAAAVFITFAAGKLWGLGLIALPILPAVLPDSIINRFTSIGDMKDSSTSYRVYIWMGTAAMLKDFWLSGIGMGAEAFKSVYPFYSYSGIVAPHSHNLFLQIMVESGICGIAVFLLIMVFFFKKMALGYRIGGKGDEFSTVMTALSAGICGFLVQGLFDNCFYNYRVLLVFWCVIGMAVACTKVAKKITEEEA